MALLPHISRPCSVAPPIPCTFDQEKHDVLGIPALGIKMTDQWTATSAVVSTTNPRTAAATSGSPPPLAPSFLATRPTAAAALPNGLFNRRAGHRAARRQRLAQGDQLLADVQPAVPGAGADTMAYVACSRRATSPAASTRAPTGRRPCRLVPRAIPALSSSRMSVPLPYEVGVKSSVAERQSRDQRRGASSRTTRISRPPPSTAASVSTWAMAAPK